MSDTARRRLHRHHRSPGLSRCDQEIARPGEGVPLRRLRHRPGRPAHQRHLHHDPANPGVPRMPARRPRPVYRLRRPDDYPSRQPAPLRLHLPREDHT